jgi:hypothetical protein
MFGRVIGGSPEARPAKAGVLSAARHATLGPKAGSGVGRRRGTQQKLEHVAFQHSSAL